MINKRNYKNAEITTQQIVILVILLASFIVLLFFLFKLNVKELSEKEICQSSVQLSSKNSFFEGNLDCKTNYICISGGGECKGFVSSETIKLNLNDKLLKNQIMKTLADEMVDCWWMFGVGKINYADKGAFDKTVCATCAEIAFGEQLINSKIKSISYDDFYKFLKTNYTNKDKTQTYFDYLKLEKLDKMSKFYLEKEISFDKIYGVYTARAKKGKWLEIFPFVDKDPGNPQDALPPVILERAYSSRLECSYFVTTP